MKLRKKFQRGLPFRSLSFLKAKKGEIATIIALGSMAFILLTTLVTTFISKKPQTTSTKAAGTCGSTTCASKNSKCQLGSGGKCYSIGSSCRNNSYCANEETNASCCGGGGGGSPAKSPTPNKTTNPTAAKPTSGGGGCPPASGPKYDWLSFNKCICTNCFCRGNNCAYCASNAGDNKYKIVDSSYCCPPGNNSSACKANPTLTPSKISTTPSQSCTGNFSCVSSTTYCSTSDRGTSAQDASCSNIHTGDKCCKKATPTKIPSSKPTSAQTTPQITSATTEPKLTETPSITSSIPGPVKIACSSPGICRYDIGLFGRQCDWGEENIGQKCYDNFEKYGWQWGNCCAKKLESSPLPNPSTTPATIGCEGPYKCLMVCNSQGNRYSKKADENVYVDNKGRVYDSQNCRSYTECGCTDKLNEAQSAISYTFTSTSQQAKADSGEIGYIISMPGGGLNFVSGVNKF